MENTISLKTLAKMIDHSLLHPTMTDQAIVSGCELAREYDVATACIKPYAIKLAKSILDGSEVGVCAVIAFPHGNSTTAIKVQEAEEAVGAGASVRFSERIGIMFLTRSKRSTRRLCVREPS